MENTYVSFAPTKPRNVGCSQHGHHEGARQSDSAFSLFQAWIHEEPHHPGDKGQDVIPIRLKVNGK